MIEKTKAALAAAESISPKSRISQDNNEVKYIEHIFGDWIAEGYIYVAHIPAAGKIIGKYFQYPDIFSISNMSGKDDIYISPNTFYIPSRKTANIRHFRTLYIDLDLKQYAKAETVYMAHMLADEGRIPVPTMIVDSGRGIHLYWRLQDAPVGALATWERVEKYLCESLRDLGADSAATDPARLLRLPGTRNSRNGTTCKIMVMNDIRYNLGELAEKYVPRVPRSKNTPEKSSYTKIGHIYNSYSLHLARIHDLETLVRLRGGNVTGYRNSILHMYAYWTWLTSADPDEAREAVYRMNDRFSEPLPMADVAAILRSCARTAEEWETNENNGYNYKNQTIIDVLDISREEQKKMKTIIGTEEKRQRENASRRLQRRNENGETQRQIHKNETTQKIYEMAAQGLTQAEIASCIGVSRRTVCRAIQSLKIELL